MFGTTSEETVLEYTEAVLVYDLRRTVYNAEGQLADPYAHYLCRSRGYRLCRRLAKHNSTKKLIFMYVTSTKFPCLMRFLHI